MNGTRTQIPEAELEALLAWADDQIARLEARSVLLGRLHDCVVAQDMEALERLLASHAASVQGDGADRRRAALARRLAVRLGVRPAEVTLARVGEALDGATALAVNDRRERLLLLIEETRRKAGAVGRLVRFTLEVNSQLLALMAGADMDSATYSPRGAVAHSHQGMTFEHSA